MLNQLRLWIAVEAMGLKRLCLIFYNLADTPLIVSYLIANRPKTDTEKRSSR